MSHTFTEREAIKQLIDYIQAERGRLWQEYTKAISRLADLDKIENISDQQEVHTATIVAKQDKLRLETEKEKEEKQNETPSMTLDEAIKKHNELNRLEVEKEVKTEEKSRYSVPRSPYRDVKRISHTIASILKEAGVPVKTKDLISKMEERGVSTNSPYVLLSQAKEYHPRIERALHGYYQYKL